MAKSYLLLFEQHTCLIWMPVKADSCIFAAGAPALFGGTRDQDASSQEKPREAVIRELKEESNSQIRLLKDAKLNDFYSASPKGVKMHFYWTSDFAGNILRFQPNKEVKDVLSIDALSLKRNATALKACSEYLMFLCGTSSEKGKEHFRTSESAKAIYHWVTKIFQSQPYEFSTVVPGPWVSGPFGNPG
jgi:hypothetical protein